MSEAPRDGRWILVEVRLTDEYAHEQHMVVAAQFVSAHGAFCGLPAGAGLGHVQSPVWPFSWVPQPTQF